MARTMSAYRLTGGDPPAAFSEVPVPEPGPGQVLVKVAGVGLCGTDLHFLEAPELFGYELPMTLGHESAGWVEELGPGVEGWEPGQAVAVVASSFCGRCGYCVRGDTNYCTNHQQGRGFGIDGGLAEFVVVPQRELVALTTLDAHLAAPLTDAGATSYHAVRRVAPKLVPGWTAVVIGVGGLGSFAVQYLKMMGRTRVVAVDTSERRLEHARYLGADEVFLSEEGIRRTLRAFLGPDRAEVVMDFVGIDDTMRTALACAKDLGTVALVGAGGGKVAVGHGFAPRECEVWAPMGYNLGDLARRGGPSRGGRAAHRRRAVQVLRDRGRLRRPTGGEPRRPGRGDAERLTPND